MVFYQLGQFMSRTQLDQLLLDVGVHPETLGVSIQEDVLKKMLAKRRLQRLYEWRSTYGFDNDQLHQFKDAFEKSSKLVFPNGLYQPGVSIIELDVVASIAETL